MRRSDREKLIPGKYEEMREKARVRRRKENASPETYATIRKSQRKYYEAHRVKPGDLDAHTLKYETSQRYRKTFQAKNPEKHLENVRKSYLLLNWGGKHPDGRRAHNLVNNAVIAGRLDKPTTCRHCKKHSLSICAFHKNYEKPFCVLWLCRKCLGYIQTMKTEKKRQKARTG